MKISKKWLQELKKLHRLIIHNDSRVKEDHKWYRLARKETKMIEKLSFPSEELNLVCSKCFRKRRLVLKSG